MMLKSLISGDQFHFWMTLYYTQIHKIIHKLQARAFELARTNLLTIIIVADVAFPSWIDGSHSEYSGKDNLVQHWTKRRSELNLKFTTPLYIEPCKTPPWCYARYHLL